MIENDKEDTDKVVIKIFQNKMQQKVSANDIDPIDMEKYAKYNVRNAVVRKKKILKG